MSFRKPNREVCNEKSEYINNYSLLMKRFLPKGRNDMFLAWQQSQEKSMGKINYRLLLKQ